MALDVIVESLDDVPENLHGEYVERDGQFVLQLNGAWSQADREALRKSLQKERTGHKETKGRLTAFGEHTPESIEEVIANREELQLQIDAAGGDDDEKQAKLDELVDRRTQAKLRPLQRKFDALQTDFNTVTGERDTLQTEKDRGKILAGVTGPKLLAEVGVTLLKTAPDAVEDMELWALHNFEIDGETGKVVSRETLGVPGLSPKDVFLDMKSNGQRRHWFGETIGAGARVGKPGSSFAHNPFAEGTFSLTECGKIVTSDPKKAVSMAKAATTKTWDGAKFLPPSLRK